MDPHWNWWALLSLGNKKEYFFQRLINYWNKVDRVIISVSIVNKHTQTQPFYCSSGICPGPPGWAGTRKAKPVRLKPTWIYWSKRQWVAVASAGLYAKSAPHPRQPRQHPTTQFLQAGCVKAMKAKLKLKSKLEKRSTEDGPVYGVAGYISSSSSSSSRLNREDAMDHSRWRKLKGIFVDHNGCEWVNVSSGTGSPGLSRTKSKEP